jgi:hypothetical protein
MLDYSCGVGYALSVLCLLGARRLQYSYHSGKPPLRWDFPISVELVQINPFGITASCRKILWRGVHALSLGDRCLHVAAMLDD